MKATRLPCETETRWKIGNSARHGSHHEAHLLITTGTPRSASSRARRAGRPPGRSWLACACNAASGCGEPDSRARAWVSVIRAGAESCGERESPSCSSPTTRSASTANAAAAIEALLGVIAAKRRRSDALHVRLRVLYPHSTTKSGAGVERPEM